MAIEKTYLLGKNITLGCGFDLQAKAPLDSRQVVPEYDGLQALIDGNAAYEGMIVYDEGTKKTYQAQLADGVLAFREFGINEAELKDLIASETTAAMEFKGAATALPENPSKGDFYKVTAGFEVAGEAVKVGDSIVYDGAQWVIIPSGDDIEDTWRPVTDVDNDATLTFAAGDKLDVAVASNGTVTYSHEAIDAPTDKTAEGDEKTRTYITAVETDGFGHITGYKTATENVEDTNTEYTFEGQSDEATSVYFQVTSNEEGASAEVVYLDAYSKNEADDKFVAKETGKSLVSDDEIARLANVDNYDDEEIRGLIDDIDNHSHENKTVLDGITAAKVADWDDAVSKEHTHSFADSDVEDAISKKHSHTFVEAELNKIADGDVAKWNAAYQHSLVDHAPANAQENVVETVKVNGEALEVTDKVVNIIIPESTKVEASETNGNIKVDGEEVTVYEHPDKHAITDVDGLEDALAKRALAADFKRENGKSTLFYGVPEESTDYYRTEFTDTGMVSFGDSTDYSISSNGMDGALTLDFTHAGLKYTATRNDGSAATVKNVAFAEDVAGAYAAKATTYTKEEVDALLTNAMSWGEF